MTSTKILLVAAGAAVLTFAIILIAIQLVSKPPSGFGLIPFYLLLPAEILGESLASRAAFLITGFLEFFLVYWLGLRGWRRIHGRKRVQA